MHMRVFRVLIEFDQFTLYFIKKKRIRMRILSNISMGMYEARKIFVLDFLVTEFLRVWSCLVISRSLLYPSKN
ncbi:hypothetical protein CDL12_02479 [Handroanthus impetiginosus]|uniref:Uncharacterized protein n=1 Tax=Handroanthus impetiginosus TaxID=429701 RepID=A0A2G9I4W2_9LAMI|nr:hypothetical protein CDL12_02479 [Handroanthus impetiginosus]